MARRLWGIGLAALAIAGCGSEDKNVHAEPVCSIGACGGDPTGQWEITAACIVEEDCASESGTVTGSYTFEGNGFSYDWLIETGGCGFRGEHDAGGSGSYYPDGNTLYRDDTLTVDGDVLTLLEVDPRDDGYSFTLERVPE
jgi:hypothetical protein